MGVVYAAEDIRLGQRVALKFIADSLAKDAVAIARFQREARTASALSHPHICTIYAVDVVDGRPFIAMELLSGESLQTRLGRGPLPTTEIIDISCQLVDALVAAHAHNVVHRDIKPGNIFISGEKVIKLLDFGLAKEVPPDKSEASTTLALTTRVGQALGTVAYMSPEQILGDPLDGRSDLFSLGVVLFEMMTGRLPFREPTVTKTLSAVLHEEPRIPDFARASQPAPLITLMLQLLKKDREQRVQTASALLDQLQVLKTQEATPRQRPRSDQGAATRHSNDREAYRLYMRGRFHWGKRYQGGIMRAIDYFELAIKIDPDYALAHVRLADAFAFVAFNSIALPTSAYVRARAAAQQALAIDANLAEAHASLALVRLGADHDIERALAEFDHALRLSPQFAIARIYSAWVLVLIGQVEEALVEAQRAHAQEPTSRTLTSGLAYTYFLARRYAAAIDACDRCLAVAPQFPVALAIKGTCLGQLRRYDEAVSALEHAVRESLRVPCYFGLLGTYYARMGRTADAEAVLRELESMRSERYVAPHAFTYIYAALGNHDAAFAYQEQACAEGASPFDFLSPVISHLFADPRHSAYLQRMGLKVDLQPFFALT